MTSQVLTQEMESFTYTGRFAALVQRKDHGIRLCCKLGRKTFPATVVPRRCSPNCISLRPVVSDARTYFPNIRPLSPCHSRT